MHEGEEQFFNENFLKLTLKSNCANGKDKEKLQLVWCDMQI